MTVVEKIQEHFTSRVVFSEPVEADGVIVVPAARVTGGGGGGQDDSGAEGGGFGLYASPVGAWVIEGGRARWKPSLDVLWLVGGGYLVAMSYFYYTWRIARDRARSGS